MSSMWLHWQVTSYRSVRIEAPYSEIPLYICAQDFASYGLLPVNDYTWGLLIQACIRDILGSSTGLICLKISWKSCWNIWSFILDAFILFFLPLSFTHGRIYIVFWWLLSHIITSSFSLKQAFSIIKYF